MDKVKLKWRIFSFLLGFCGLLILLLWLFQTVFLFDTYKLIRKNEMDRVIHFVGQNIDSPDLPLIFDYLLRENSIFITLTSEFSPPSGSSASFHLMIDGRGRMSQETITKTQVFTLRDGREISLTFHAIITPVDATVNTLKLQLAIVTGVMVVMSVGLAILIAKNISTPLENINKNAKILATGNYDVVFNGRGFLEIRELSETLNTAAKELSKVERLRRELIANVSHDLRTPLSLIYSYAEMMHDFPQEVTEAQTRIIMDETNRLASLVSNLLDLSRLESGMQTLTLSAINLTALLRKITRRTAELVRQQGFEITFTHDEGDCYVRADEVQLTQAYYNLLLNAINYSGDRKLIEVRQIVLPGEVRVEITDYGHGITEEELPFIWERYYKSDENHVRAITGSGLGLSIVRKIFSLHEFPHGVDSKHGEGSTFWFTAPIIAPPIPPSA